MSRLDEIKARRRDEIKARAEAATDGPWLLDGPWWTDDGGPEPTALPCVVDASRALVVFPPDATDVGMKRPEDRDANMTFIAAARDDVPWLVSEVERLTAERDALAARVARLRETVARVEPTLSLLHHRGLIDSQNNRKDVADALEIVRAALTGSEADTTDVDVCSGDADCTSALHVHGCFADMTGPCTDPDEHQPTAQEATTDAGHQCEPYYSRAECGQCGWQEQWCVTCSRKMCGCATDTTNQEDKS